MLALPCATHCPICVCKRSGCAIWMLRSKVNCLKLLRFVVCRGVRLPWAHSHCSCRLQLWAVVAILSGAYDEAAEALTALTNLALITSRAEPTNRMRALLRPFTLCWGALHDDVPIPTFAQRRKCCLCLVQLAAKLDVVVHEPSVDAVDENERAGWCLVLETWVMDRRLQGPVRRDASHHRVRR